MIIKIFHPSHDSPCHPPSIRSKSTGPWLSHIPHRVIQYYTKLTCDNHPREMRESGQWIYFFPSCNALRKITSWTYAKRNVMTEKFRERERDSETWSPPWLSDWCHFQKYCTHMLERRQVMNWSDDTVRPFGPAGERFWERNRICETVESVLYENFDSKIISDAFTLHSSHSPLSSSLSYCITVTIPTLPSSFLYTLIHIHTKRPLNYWDFLFHEEGSKFLEMRMYHIPPFRTLSGRGMITSWILAIRSE
jgi:hypothetical protein